MGCACDDEGAEPLGTPASPYDIWPGTTWSARLWFWRVGARVVVTTEGEAEPDDADPINLSSPARTGSAELRPTTDHTGTAIADLSVVIDTPQTGERRGRVTVTLPATVSEFPQITPRAYVFDVRLEANADPDDVVGSHVLHVRVLEGSTR